MTISGKMLKLGESARVFGTVVTDPDHAAADQANDANNRAIPAGKNSARNGQEPAPKPETADTGKAAAKNANGGTGPHQKNKSVHQAVTSNPDRLLDIARIQHDLVRRRRLRLVALMVKLAFFVALPTFLTGVYFYKFATPLYETYTEFVIQKASPSLSSIGTGGLFSGTALGASQDSIIVQGFLTSREAMLKLDAELGFKAHFSSDQIDPIMRLAPDASDEDMYNLYRKKLAVGFDPTEGIIRMTVIAASAQASQDFATALVRYAEERVDKISHRARDDQMSGAKESYAEAETNLTAAQKRLVDLQQRRGVMSSEVEVSSQMSIINSLELELETKTFELQEIKSNPKPNQTRADLTQAEISRLSERIATLRSQLTDNSTTSASLSKIAGELSLAQTDVATRQLLLQQAVSYLEISRVEANRQTRYLAIGVAPIAPDKATLPRKFENTALSLVIFIGIYLLASLTVSILREQVSV